MRLPGILFFSCYHFFDDCAIVFVMKRTQSEIVIIPHPNEQKKIADVQKRVLLALQEGCRDESVWAPSVPLYVRDVCDAKAKKLADWKKSLRECMLTEVRADGERIVLKTEIVTAEGKKISANLKLAEQIRSGHEKAKDRQSAAAAVSKAFGSDMAERFPLPLRLAVFRLAQVEFRSTETHTEWTVEDSIWVKTEVHR